jgi:hypothetical protein
MTTEPWVRVVLGPRPATLADRALPAAGLLTGPLGLSVYDLVLLVRRQGQEEGP